jgi:hypothetical protein
MPPNARAQAKKWVEETLVRVLAERGMKLDMPLDWTPDFDHEIFTVEAKIGGMWKLWRLSYKALDDCIADKNIQGTIEHSLRMFFGTSHEDGVLEANE